MPEEKSLPSWWATLPGIITALAALLTAVGGVIVTLDKVHFFDKPQQSEVSPNPGASPAAPGVKKPTSAGRKQNPAPKSVSEPGAGSTFPPDQPSDPKSEQNNGSGTSAPQTGMNTPAFRSPSQDIGKKLGAIASARAIHLVRIGNMVLEYNSVDGSAVMKGSDGAVLRTYSAGGFAPGWTQIVWTQHGTLFYNSRTGVGSVVRFDDSGNGNTIKTYPSPGSPSFARGWTSITLTADGLLFKNAATGETTLGEIDSRGNFRTK
jgi:hypothetical protein